MYRVLADSHAKHGYLLFRPKWPPFKPVLTMEPGIPDSAYCLFRSPVTGTRQGKIVIVQLRDEVDPESGERYTVKRYQSEKMESEEGWRHTRIVLRPENHDFEPIVLVESDEEKLQVVAELVQVLGSRKDETESPPA
jgi:SOS-response transcriptional repressor LexA